MRTRTVLARGPFRFDLALRYYMSSPSTIAEVVSADAYERVFLGPSGPSLMRVSARSGGLQVAVSGDDGALDRAVVLATRAFGLADDPNALIGDDSIVGRYVERYRGLRPLAIPDPFEALVWAILGQQINIAFAATLKRRLLERYGQVVQVDGRAFRLFPVPELLVDLGVEEMRLLQFSRQKTAYIRELARAVASGSIDLERLRTLPDGRVIEELTRLRGIGLWTAEYLLLRGFGRPDAVPAGDMGLRAILGRLHGLGRNATEAEVRALVAPWAPWRGYVATYLWFALQQRDY